MADRYPEMWELSSCELGHARRVAVRTRRYFSSWHQAHGTAGCAIAHWRDASTEKTIIVVPNSSWCLLCAMLKIAFCSKNRSATHNCAEADVIVTSCSCIEIVLRTHTWLPQPRCCAVICPLPWTAHLYLLLCVKTFTMHETLIFLFFFGGGARIQWTDTCWVSSETCWVAQTLTSRTLAACCCSLLWWGRLGYLVTWSTLSRLWIRKLYLTPKTRIFCIKCLVSVFSCAFCFFVLLFVPVSPSSSPPWLPSCLPPVSTSTSPVSHCSLSLLFCTVSPSILQHSCFHSRLLCFVWNVTRSSSVASPTTVSLN